MSQGVTYADLRFVRTPPEKSQEKDPSEGELTYENIQGPRPQEERTPTTTEDPKEPDRRTWYATLALLATCLLLLAIAIGLGVRYWQVSRQLQQANEEGSILERRIGSKEESLDQAQAELHSTNGTLWGCWAAGNRTQEQLRQANQTLTLMQREKETLQDKQQQLQWEKERLQEERDAAQQNLNQTMKRLEEAKSCQQIGCCPPGWNLFRWKCLWISTWPDNWGKSKEACRAKSSQLLILKPWSAEQLRDAAFIDKKYQYWIGLRRDQYTWKWVDDTSYTGSETFEVGGRRYSFNCIAMSNGALKNFDCWEARRFICEKAASPDQPL